MFVTFYYRINCLFSSFSLFHWNDDEAAIRRLHLTLSCTMAITLLNCMIFVSMSCFVYVLLYILCPFLWLFFLISPLSYREQCVTFTGMHSLPIVETCSNHVCLANCLYCLTQFWSKVEAKHKMETVVSGVLNRPPYHVYI